MYLFITKGKGCSECRVGGRGGKLGEGVREGTGKWETSPQEVEGWTNNFHLYLEWHS